MGYDPKEVDRGTYCSTQKEIYKLIKKLVLTRTRPTFKLHDCIGDFNEQCI